MLQGGPLVSLLYTGKKPGGDATHVSPLQNRTELTVTANNVIPQDSNDLDDFGVDLFAPPQAAQPTQLSAIPDDENTRIKAFVDSTASEWQKQTQESFASGRGYGRGSQARGHGGRGGGSGGGSGSGRIFEKKTPPHGYVCHRCGVTGHYIQHCPTNGDPAYDMRKVKPPTGIPKTMLVANPDGSYALPTGEVAVLRANEAIFEKEVTGMLQKRTMLDNIPPELCCPLCRGVLKEAVLTSKCCFKSFCDKCIRNEIITKGKCVCGATNVLADDLLPNRTLRDAIDHFMESQVQTTMTMTTSSGNNAASRLQVQDMESARLPRQKPVSPSASASLKDQQVEFPSSNGNDKPGGVKIALHERDSGADTVDKTPVPPIVQDDGLSLLVAPTVDEVVQQRQQRTAAIVSGADLTRSQMKAAKPKAKRKRQLPSGDQQNFPPFQENGFGEELGPGPSHNLQDDRYCSNCGSYEHPAWDCPMNHMTGPGPYNYPPQMHGPDYYMQWGGMPHQPMMYPGYGGGFQGPYNGYGGGPEMMPYSRGMGHEGYEANGFHNPYNREYFEPTPLASRADESLMSREQFEARKAEMRRMREAQTYQGRDGDGDHGVAESNGVRNHKKHSRAPDDSVGEDEQHGAEPKPHRVTRHHSEYNSDIESDVAPKRKRSEERKSEKSRR